MMTVPDIRLKRIYEAAAADDGQRILIDRIWPRGVSKQNAALSLWLNEVAPSTELRKWFDHDPPGGRNLAGATVQNSRKMRQRPSICMNF
jgi:uncharacterized protein YeaO (DUF488 family)